MLTLQTPVYFGKDNRFKAYQFDNDRFSAQWIAEYGDHTVMKLRSSIFVEDTTQMENEFFPLVVFHDWCENIDNLEQVSSIVSKRFPE